MVLQGITLRALFAGLLLHGLTAASQTPDPYDPGAPVPPVQYASVFTGPPLRLETPVADWTQSNVAVGQFMRGHADILRWESRQNSSDPAAGQGVKP